MTHLHIATTPRWSKTNESLELEYRGLLWNKLQKFNSHETLILRIYLSYDVNEYMISALKK